MMMDAYEQDWQAKVWSFLLSALLLGGFALYVAFATFASLVVPPLFLILLAPFGIIILAFAPHAQAMPKTIILPMLYTALALMPLWPVYIHIKPGPLPIITPPRIIFYLLTVIWLYDMTVSAYRRGQFLVAIKNSPWLVGLVFSFFAVVALSVPMAHGRVIAIQEFIRQFIIWFLPFCIFLTYVRKVKAFQNMLCALTLGAGLVALIAIAEFVTKTPLATKLGPLISDNALWLQITQEAKSRDGGFRAQATHTHPLSLGEYLAFCSPIAFSLFCGVPKRRWVWALILGVILVGIVATNARGAYLAAATGLFVAGTFYATKIMAMRRFFTLRPLFGLAVLCMALSSPVVGYNVYKIVVGASGTSAANSSQARIDQIKTAWPKIVKRPIGGYGVGRAAVIIGYWGKTLSVDNYYLTLIVDCGVPGPVLFVAFLWVAAAASRRHAKTTRYKTQAIFLGFSAALLSFLVMRLILSQTGNLSTLYPLLGAFAGVHGRLNFSHKHAKSV